MGEKEIDINLCNHCRIHKDQLKETMQETREIKQQNNDIRERMKAMSQQLDQQIVDRSKQKFVPKKEPTSFQHTSIEILQKQIDNKQKQIKILQKAYKKIMKKNNDDFGSKKVCDLEEDVLVKKMEVGELKQQNKVLTLDKRQLERLLMKQVPENDLNNLRQTIIAKRHQVRQLKRKKEQDDKNYEEQENYIQEILKKQEEVCEQLGVENVQAKKPDENFFTKKLKGEDSSLSDGDIIQQVPSVELYKQYENRLRILKDSIEQNSKVHKIKVNKTEQQITELEQQKVQMKQKIQEKKYEYQQMKKDRDRKMQQLNANGEFTNQEIEIQRKLQIRYVQEKPLQPMNTDTALSFKDQEEIAYPDTMYIAEVTITSYENFVIGLEVVYKNHITISKEFQRIKCFQPSRDSIQQNEQEEQENQVVKSTLKMNSNQQIMQITGYSTSSHIEYLKIVSSCREFICGGNSQVSQNPKVQGKFFNMEFKKNERPTSFFGVIDVLTKKQKNKAINKPIKNEYALVSIGVELRKKEIFDLFISMKRKKQNEEKQMKIQKQQDSSNSDGESDQNSKMSRSAIQRDSNYFQQKQKSKRRSSNSDSIEVNESFEEKKSQVIQKRETRNYNSRRSSMRSIINSSRRQSLQQSQISNNNTMQKTQNSISTTQQQQDNKNNSVKRQDSQNSSQINKPQQEQEQNSDIEQDMDNKSGSSISVNSSISSLDNNYKNNKQQNNEGKKKNNDDDNQYNQDSFSDLE